MIEFTYKETRHKQQTFFRRTCIKMKAYIRKDDSTGNRGRRTYGTTGKGITQSACIGVSDAIFVSAGECIWRIESGTARRY
jgi:hypothetical protein